MKFSRSLCGSLLDWRGRSRRKLSVEAQTEPIRRLHCSFGSRVQGHDFAPAPAGTVQHVSAEGAAVQGGPVDVPALPTWGWRWVILAGWCPSAEVGDSKYSEKGAYPSPSYVAMVLPPKPFNFAALEVQVRTAAKRAFREVASAHPEEQLCAFALYSDDGAMTVCPSINTTQHLAAMQRQQPDEAPYYRFATPEWKYEATGAEAAFRAICLKVRTQALAYEGVSKADAKTLAGVSPLRARPAPRGFATFKRSLFETCLRVLESLRSDRLFQGVTLVFAVSDTDSSARREQAMIKRLNDKAVVNEFRSWTKTWAQ